MSSKARDAVKRAMSKTATFPPFSKHGPPPPPNNNFAPAKRDIPREHPFDPKALKPMSKALLASSTALGHALTAYRYLSRIKSATVSPDGRIGGRGYVMEIQAARQKLYDASEALSAVSDTLYDEIQAPHWKPKLAMLDDNDKEDVSRFVGEAQEVLENPEEEAEEQLEAIEKENDGKGSKKKDKDEGAESSQLPGTAPSAEDEPMPKADGPMVKEASVTAFEQLCDTVDEPNEFVTARFVTKDELRAIGEQADPQMLADVAARSKAMTERIMQRIREADMPAEVLPGGPRVDNRDPDGGDGPWGSFNPPEDGGSDGWALEEGVRHPDEYDYPSEWDNDTSHKQGESVLPNQDDTPTEADDFGLGYGARNQGVEHAGEWGPHAELPGVPSQSSGDIAPTVDVSLNQRHSLESLLPGDTDEPVARMDYYEGEKGNLVQTAVGWAQSVAPVDEDLSLVDTGYVHEDLQTPWLPLGEPTPRN